MKAVKLARGVRLLSQHVDSLELTCALTQVRLLLDDDDADPLDRRLATLQQLARAGTPQIPVDSDWKWHKQRVVVLPSATRAGVRYALQSPDWRIFVAGPLARTPRLTVQCRAAYLMRVGPVAAYDEVTQWATRHLLSRVGGVPSEQPEARWTIARLDLAADVLGARLTPRRVPDFTSRSRVRREYHGGPAVDVARVHRLARVMTGVDLGRRGGKVFARVYDKQRQAKRDAPIRARWAQELGRNVRENEAVWRVEFELRGAFIRELAEVDGEHVSTAPRAILTSRLDAIWRYLTGSWLALRRSNTATRLSRAAVEPWWAALSTASAWAVPGDDVPLTRRRRTDPDPRPMMRQAAGVLAAYGARADESDLNQCIRDLSHYIWAEQGGPSGFHDAVSRAKRRLPGASRTQEEALTGVLFDVRAVRADILDSVLDPPDLGPLGAAA